MRGGASPELRVSADVLRDSETGERLERMWAIANSGGFELTVEEPENDEDLPKQ